MGHSFPGRADTPPRRPATCARCWLPRAALPRPYLRLPCRRCGGHARGHAPNRGTGTGTGHSGRNDSSSNTPRVRGTSRLGRRLRASRFGRPGRPGCGSGERWSWCRRWNCCLGSRGHGPAGGRGPGPAPLRRGPCSQPRACGQAGRRLGWQPLPGRGLGASGSRHCRSSEPLGSRGRPA